ncbi:DUF3618 domain-containing protein [Plantactinospora sp. KBS50]|uniref:DUF3618 domain-containing protein n=1 Tax=Plantactinospora sp. KBS50 TaxID=2024580 RepID=UPI000BAACB28|nr:DUF3618 domain-containing protein [Plantactinospora sp. KBS50]ASW54587.1 hypothetical protein CIK06_10930 [Plantactinospora sp. KBS50]
MTVNNGKQDPEALREEIKRTRSDLGETVQALAAKADVKARLKESAAQTTARVRQQAAQRTDRVREQAGQTAEAVRRDPVPWAAVAAGVVAVLAVVLVVRGRRR